MAEPGTTHVIEIESGIGEPGFIPLTSGKELAPLSVGRRGMWRIESAKVLDVHAFVYFDGTALFLQSADEAAPAMVDGYRVGKAWTELHAPAKIEIGTARLHFRSLVAREDETVAQIRPAVQVLPQIQPPQQVQPPPHPPRQATQQFPPPRQPTAPPQSQREPTQPPQSAGAARPFSPGAFAHRADDESTRLNPLDVGKPVPPPGGSQTTTARPAAGPLASAQGDFPAPLHFGPESGMTRMGTPARTGQIPRAPTMAGGFQQAAYALPAQPPPQQPPPMQEPPMGYPPQQPSPMYAGFSPPQPTFEEGPLTPQHPFPGAIPVAPPYGTGPFPQQSNFQPNFQQGSPYEPGHAAPTQNGMPFGQSGMQPLAIPLAAAPPSAAEKDPLRELGEKFMAASAPKKALIVMLPFLFLSVVYLFFVDDAPAPGPKAATSASVAIAPPKVPVTVPQTGPQTGPSQPFLQPLTGPQTPPSATAPKVPPPPGSALPPGTKTLERMAVDAVAAGSPGRAAQIYEELARQTPSNPVYPEAARILRAKLDGGT